MRCVRGILVLLVLFVWAYVADARCTGRLINPITDVCWWCVFPIKIAGVPITPNLSGLKDTPNLSDSPICICPLPVPPYFRIGIPVSFWEVARYAETVRDPFCFPSLGISLSNPAGYFMKGKATDQGGEQENDETFAQAHYFIFPVWSLMEILVDFACIEHGGFDVFYMTEVDPLWNSDLLSFIIQPESLIFANPIAQLACVADAVAANFQLPLDPLFWCMGSWGSAYPMTGHVKDDNYVQANAATAARLIYKLGRQGLLWDTAMDLCTPLPALIWQKSHFRLQIARPVVGLYCWTIGTTNLVWGAGKNPPMVGDNFMWMIFRKRECCAF